MPKQVYLIIQALQFLERAGIKNMDQTSFTKDFVVSNPLGIHARPASVFVQTAAGFESNVTVTNLDSGNSADGKSVMSMLMLAAPQGTRIRVAVTGPDAASAMESLSGLIEGGFDE